MADEAADQSVASQDGEMGRQTAPTQATSVLRREPEKHNNRHNFVGSWIITIFSATDKTGPAQRLVRLAALTEDGVFTASEALPYAKIRGRAATRQLHYSDAYGTWEAASATDATVSFMQLVSDGNGSFVATMEFRARITLTPDGSGWNGRFERIVKSPDGRVVGSGDGTAQATRLPA